MNPPVSEKIDESTIRQGKDRVGTAPELPLARRVQLAVVAHIRHVYTDYDLLLRTNDYLLARRKVEQPCLDVLTQWREDQEDDPDAMEEILREVIVIPDDDEDETDDYGRSQDPEYPRKQPTPQTSRNRENSVEIVSERAIVEDFTMQPSEYNGAELDGNLAASHGNPDHWYVQQDRLHSPHDRRRQFRYLRETSHLHHTWEEALTRRRQNPVAVYPKQWPIGQEDWEDTRVISLDSPPRHVDLTQHREPQATKRSPQFWMETPSERSAYQHDRSTQHQPVKVVRLGNVCLQTVPHSI